MLTFPSIPGKTLLLSKFVTETDWIVAIPPTNKFSCTFKTLLISSILIAGLDSISWLLQFGYFYHAQDQGLGALQVCGWCWTSTGNPYVSCFKKFRKSLLTSFHGCVDQQRDILSRSLPENLKLAIAKRIENNIFSKVKKNFYEPTNKLSLSLLSLHFNKVTSLHLQVPFLTGMHGLGDIRTMFSAEVSSQAASCSNSRFYSIIRFLLACFYNLLCLYIKLQK